MSTSARVSDGGNRGSRITRLSHSCASSARFICSADVDWKRQLCHKLGSDKIAVAPIRGSHRPLGIIVADQEFADRPCVPSGAHTATNGTRSPVLVQLTPR